MKPRDNPFATERVSKLRYRIDGTYGDIVERLDELGRRAALIGRHGNGKTTFLDGLERHLVDTGHKVERVFVNSANPRVPLSFWSTDLNDKYVLLDGKERLSFVAWSRFKRACRAARGVVIVEHNRGAWPVLYECSTSIALFEELVDELVQTTDRGMVEEKLTKSSLSSLFDKHGGNVRDCLRELYDRFAEIEVVSQVEPSHVR